MADGDLQKQIDRLTAQVDRMSQAMDGAFLRKEVFVVESASLRAAITVVEAAYARQEESLKWMRRSLMLAVVGMVASVAGAVLIARLTGG